MCLGSAKPDYKPPTPRVVEPGPPSPQDKVNNVTVENINPRSKQEEKRKANQGSTASSQSGSKTNKSY